MVIETGQIMAIVFTIFLSVAGLLKYVFYLLERHKDYMDSRFDEHDKKLESHASAIKVNHDMAHKIKEELYSGYIKSDRLEADFSEVMKKFDQVFGFLTSLSRDVNQLIGKDKAKK